MQVKHFNTLGLLCGAALFLFLVSSCSRGSDNLETKTQTEQPESNTDAKQEKDFLLNAYSYNLMVQHYSKKAEGSVARESVRSFVKLSLPLHEKQNKELAAYARSKQWVLPASVGTDVENYLKEIKQLPPAEFELAYLQVISDIQHKAIPAYTAATQLPDLVLSQWANEALPKLEAHAETVDQLLAEGKNMGK